ncbi:hypothetical protein [Actinoplanes sp. NPDC049265]|uniref:hypothetical protein n=1 Tax=Actinoplanes sp. NPDC049265 TaxID=3363902 RepID=UPI00372309D7
MLYDAGGHEIKQWRTADDPKMFYTSDHVDSSPAYYRDRIQGTTTEDGYYRDRIEATDENGFYRDRIEATDENGFYRDRVEGTTTEDGFYRDRIEAKDFYTSSGPEDKQFYKSVGPDDKEFYTSTGPGEKQAYTSTGPGETETRMVRPTSQVNEDGSVTNFEYRDNGEYVGTTGDDHVLYDANDVEIKQWKGDDESKALFYHKNPGTYTLSNPVDGTSTTYEDGSNRYVSQINKDKSETTFSYRDNGDYVATTGDDHVLYDSGDKEIKQWKGDDESAALYYRKNPDGTYTLSNPTDGTSTTYEDGSNRYVSQINKDKSETTFSYRGNGDYVATTGNQHVLYNSEDKELKQWTGDDESKAALYADNGDGTYTLTNTDGTSTTYESGSNHFVSQVNKDKTTTTFSYRPNGDYVGTTGNQHVLYNSAGDEIKQWTGDDESQASFYHDNGDGSYSLTDPDGTITTYDSVSNHYIKQVKKDGTVTTFQYRADGSYVGTSGDLHVLYNADGTEIKEWKGDDESSASFYHKNDDGTYTLTEPNGTVTTYNAQGQAIRIHKPGEEDQVITYNPDGTYVVTQGAHHWKYDKSGMLLEEWEGMDESKAYKYKYNDDGTLTITGPDGTNTYGANGMPISGDFLVDLKALSDAMVSIKTQRNQVESDLVEVKNTFTGMVDDWDSPAGRSFQELTGDFMNASLDLVSTLDEGLRRMHVAYNNYVASESQNAATIAAIDAAGQKLKNGVTT